MTMSISAVLDELRPQLEADYRHLHAHPELSMQEHDTAAYIENRLTELGIEHFRCGGTGVVGVIRNGDGPTVAFRADIDGLPIAEDTGLEFASAATGTIGDTEVPVMHGCGHDMHTSVGLAVAAAMAGRRGDWAGTLVLLFQPGEETAAGSAAMLADGVWDRAPKPEIVYGQHVIPLLAGTVAVSLGTAMSMADAWEVTLHGRQAHGAQPHNSIDPIVLGAHVVTRLQTIVSRTVDPREMAVLTVGTFHSGLKENIIPAKATLGLNVRTYDEKVREAVLAGIRRVVDGEVAASGAPAAEIRELYTFPPNYNDPDEAARVRDSLAQEFGEERVKVTPPLTGSEDFGRFADALGVPSVFWLFGGYPQDRFDAGDLPPNHSPRFAPTEQPSLDTGVRAALAVLLARLGV